MPKFNDSERNFVTFTTTLHKTMEHLKFCDKAPNQFYARLTNCRLQGTGTEMTCVEQSNAGMGARRSSVPTVVTIRLHSYIQSHPPPATTEVDTGCPRKKSIPLFGHPYDSIYLPNFINIKLWPLK